MPTFMRTGWHAFARGDSLFAGLGAPATAVDQLRTFWFQAAVGDQDQAAAFTEVYLRFLSTSLELVPVNDTATGTSAFEFGQYTYTVNPVEGTIVMKIVSITIAVDLRKASLVITVGDPAQVTPDLKPYLEVT
jgi:hypothetical protein